MGAPLLRGFAGGVGWRGDRERLGFEMGWGCVGRIDLGKLCCGIRVELRRGEEGSGVVWSGVGWRREE